MRLALVIITAAVLSLIASSALAYVGLSAQCEGDHMVLRIGFSDSQDVPGPDWTGVILYRETMGSAAAPVALNADHPFAWNLEDGEQHVEFEFIDHDVERDVGYGYTLRVLDSEGQEHIDSHPQYYGIEWAGCGAFPYSRGTLGWQFVGGDQVTLTIEDPCPGWEPSCACLDLTFEEFAMSWAHLAGETVQFRGTFAYQGMPVGDCCLWWTDSIEHVTDCGGEVASEAVSWSAIKKIYE